MSAPVTEAHLELAKTVIFSRDSAGRLLTAPMGAQLIADSEARATAELKKRADHWCDMHTVCAKERDQLRTECNNLRADIDAIKAILNEEKARAERAEAEVEEQCLLNGKGAEREASLLGQLERSAREIEQKRNLLTVAIKSAGDQATRAERAEAELAEQKWLKESAVKRAKELTEELAAERENVRTLRSACESICEEWGRNHDAPFRAGSNMEKRATAALAATEDAT